MASAGLPVELVWVSAELLCKETENAARLGELRRAAAAADRAMTEGRTALVATSRGVVMGGGVDGAIGVQGRIADGLVEVRAERVGLAEVCGWSNKGLWLLNVIVSSSPQILRAVATRPAFLIAKGGITSADAARRAMGARSAAVAGQAAPGVPLWVLDDECRFPGESMQSEAS